jgi:seryl-tRNA synthetase
VYITFAFVLLLKHLNLFDNLFYCRREAYNTITINKLSSDNRKLEDNLHEEQAKRNQLEKTHMKTVKGIEHNATEEIIGTLKDDIKRLQTERDDKEKQIVELKSKFYSFDCFHVGFFKLIPFCLFLMQIVLKFSVVTT